METGAVRSRLLPETQGAGHCDQMVGSPPNKNLDLQICCLYEFSQKKRFFPKLKVTFGKRTTALCYVLCDLSGCCGVSCASSGFISI